MHDSRSYGNKKVDAVIYNGKRLDDLQFEAQDFADLAVACADQAGMSAPDQRLFKQLLDNAVEDGKHKRGIQ
jgi:hypothetical protein